LAQLEDEDKEEFVASDEAPSVGQVINMSQCAHTTQQATTEKEPPRNHPALKKKIDTT